MDSSVKKLPTYFISHGGGPWPWLKKEMPFYDVLEESLKDMPKQIGVTPKAILMISAHWESNDFVVMAHPKPPMIYDYGGFPEHTYHIQYPAPGHPELAKRVQSLLTDAGFPTRLDADRGFDHGMYAPMYAIYPKAEVPVIQLSIHEAYDPELHFRLGKALAPLREEGILIIGSGLSYHNLRAMFSGDPKAEHASVEFDQWLQETVLKHSKQDRHERLLHWDQAPSARAAHPREDHLVPLFVALGAAEDEEAFLVYHEKFTEKFAVSSFRFGS